MAIKWTHKLERQCSDLWRAGRSAEAVELCGVSIASVQRRMATLKVRSSYSPADNLKKSVRKLFAEDIALMIEFAESGMSSHLIGEYFNCSGSTIRVTIRNAKQHGFDKYPRREK